jgi:hypothetical protein
MLMKKGRRALGPWPRQSDRARIGPLMPLVGSDDGEAGQPSYPGRNEAGGHLAATYLLHYLIQRHYVLVKSFQ